MVYTSGLKLKPLDRLTLFLFDKHINNNAFNHSLVH